MEIGREKRGRALLNYAVAVSPFREDRSISHAKTILTLRMGSVTKATQIMSLNQKHLFSCSHEHADA